MCRGVRATVVGTSGPDRVRATRERDVIVTLGGDDKVTRINGRDLVCSGPGDDVISGLAGDVQAGAGADTVRTDNGRQGGGPGRDDLVITFGDAFGGAGNDRVESIFGSVTGNNGDDVLVGGILIEGGAGDDVLRATDGCGPDLIPGAGDDLVKGGYGSCLTEDDVHSILDLRTAPRGMNVDLAEGLATGWGRDRIEDVFWVVGTKHDDVLKAVANEFLIIEGAGGADRLVGSPVRDDLRGDDGYPPGVGNRGTAGADVILGRGGGDDISGDEGDDRLAGGAGNDQLDGGRGSDVIDGGEGLDTVSYFPSLSDRKRGVTVNLDTATATGRGDDVLRGLESILGTYYDDVLVGDAMANTFQPSYGNDTVHSGGGDDIVLDSIPGHSASSGDDTYDGGPGVDTVSWIYSAEAITADLLAGTASGNGTEMLTAIEVLIGSTKSDRFEGDDGDNRLLGGAGDDHLDGRDGVDVLDGGSGTDICVNGEANEGCP